MSTRAGRVRRPPHSDQSEPATSLRSAPDEPAAATSPPPFPSTARAREAQIRPPRPGTPGPRLSRAPARPSPFVAGARLRRRTPPCATGTPSVLASPPPCQLRPRAARASPPPFRRRRLRHQPRWRALAPTSPRAAAGYLRRRRCPGAASRPLSTRPAALRRRGAGSGWIRQDQPVPDPLR
nr:lysine-rich arabinogalactan protein 19-like [Aegilops tauschii subsp. strangulata]